jgi:hypothetical protein
MCFTSYYLSSLCLLDKQDCDPEDLIQLFREDVPEKDDISQHSPEDPPQSPVVENMADTDKNADAKRKRAESGSSTGVASSSLPVPPPANQQAKANVPDKKRTKMNTT